MKCSLIGISFINNKTREVLGNYFSETLLVFKFKHDFFGNKGEVKMKAN